jgi:HPt (histidine-containing phosphotransfer) domain-containing protein
MELEQLLAELGVNKDEIMNRFMGNMDLYEKFMRKFPEDESYQQLETAMKDQNLEMMERSSHTLKGISGNLGFQTLFRQCDAFVQEIRGNRDMSLLNSYYDDIYRGI